MLIVPDSAWSSGRTKEDQMPKILSRARTAGKGFTVIELLIVVLIVGLLAAVGAPLYLSYIRDSRLAEGKALTTTIGAVITFTVTVAVEVSEPAIAVSVYVVVVAGETVTDPEVGCAPIP